MATITDTFEGAVCPDCVDLIVATESAENLSDALVIHAGRVTRYIPRFSEAYVLDELAEEVHYRVMCDMCGTHMFGPRRDLKIVWFD